MINIGIGLLRLRKVEHLTDVVVALSLLNLYIVVIIYI